MTTQFFKPHPLLKIYHSTFVSLPSPSNISLMWNFGSLLFLCLFIQIFSGLLLASSYTVSEASFSTTALLMETNNMNWLIRYLHTNGASLFFICLYMHTGRGLYYSSFLFGPTWATGVTILFLTMAAAFLGYVLPLNQMSFWGASVITNLFSEVPYIGPNLVQFIWGGPNVSAPTISRFFNFHFIIPFIILALVLVHITLLHQTGSNNPLGINSNLDKVPFHLYFTFKDLMGVTIASLLFTFLCLYYPLILGDDENFTMANPSMTPHHIQPEWYFLFAYAILRAVPNKLGGVIALISSILILYLTPFIAISKMKSISFYPVSKFLFWMFVWTSTALTWLGACPVEDPYVLTSQILSLAYFLYFFMNPMLKKGWDKFNLV